MTVMCPSEPLLPSSPPFEFEAEEGVEDMAAGLARVIGVVDEVRVSLSISGVEVFELNDERLEYPSSSSTLELDSVACLLAFKAAASSIFSLFLLLNDFSLL